MNSASILLVEELAQRQASRYEFTHLLLHRALRKKTQIITKSKDKF